MRVWRGRGKKRNIRVGRMREEWIEEKGMGFKSKWSPKPNTISWNAHISVIIWPINESTCCLYKEGRLLSHKSANKHIYPFVTEIISIEDKPTISRYSNRQKELIFAAVYFQGGCSSSSLKIINDRSSVFLSKSNYSSAESLDTHE